MSNVTASQTLANLSDDEFNEVLKDWPSRKATTKPAPRWKLPEPVKGSLSDMFESLTVEVYVETKHQKIRFNVDRLKDFIETYDRLIASRNRGAAYQSIYDQINNGGCEHWFDIWNVFAEGHGMNTKDGVSHGWPSWTKADALVLADLKRFWLLLVADQSDNVEQGCDYHTFRSGEIFIDFFEDDQSIKSLRHNYKKLSTRTQIPEEICEETRPFYGRLGNGPLYFFPKGISGEGIEVTRAQA